MYNFRKSKKGFTLIELMVVVAIIGVLSLLGLRLYTGQQEKAKNAIVKANAATTQTLIQAELADEGFATAELVLKAINTDWTSANGELAGMRNPYTASENVVVAADPGEGHVQVTYAAPVFTIQGYGKDVVATGFPLTAQR